MRKSGHIFAMHSMFVKVLRLLEFANKITRDYDKKQKEYDRESQYLILFF